MPHPHVFSFRVDIYTSVIGRSPTIDELLIRLRGRIKEEVSLEMGLLSILGVMDLLMASNTSARRAPLGRPQERAKNVDTNEETIDTTKEAEESKEEGTRQARHKDKVEAVTPQTKTSRKRRSSRGSSKKGGD